MQKKVLTSDILIIDSIIQVKDNPSRKQQIDSLVKEFHLAPNSKTALTREQFERFSELTEGLQMSFVAGGSSANTLTQMSKFLGPDRLKGTFIGIKGQGLYSNIIKRGLDEAGVTLYPKNLPHDVPSPQSAISFVIVFEDGQRAIATYPGNAKEIITPKYLPDHELEEMVKDSDALLVQGSLRQKLSPEFFDKMLQYRWEHNKELWLCLPTHAKFAEDNADLFQYYVPSVNKLLANDDELALMAKFMTAEQHKEWTWTEKNGVTAEEREAATAKLEDARSKAMDRVLDIFQHKSVLRDKPEMCQNQTAYITRGKKGAVVINKDGMEFIPVAEFDGKIVNNLGAGDATFAGILSGYMQGLNEKACGELGMFFAREKLQVDAARIPEPRKALERSVPELMKRVFSDERSNYVA
jgi:sugar/nucleoside kinase (ribokinase family)